MNLRCQECGGQLLRIILKGRMELARVSVSGPAFLDPTESVIKRVHYTKRHGLAALCRVESPTPTAQTTAIGGCMGEQASPDGTICHTLERWLTE